MKYMFCSTVFLLVFLFSALFCYSILSLNLKEKSTTRYYDLVDYQFLGYDSLNNDISRGFVKIPERLERNDFHTEHSGKYTLLSEFGSEEYHCEGSCWCEDKSERRVSSSIALRRPLFVLLSALTLSLGISKANEYFEEKCQIDLSSSCSDESRIRSEVQSCDKIFDDDASSFVEQGTLVQDLEENNEEMVSLDSSMGTEPLLEEWICEGHCVDNRKIKDPNGLDLQSIFDCRSLRTRREFSFDSEELKEFGRRISDTVEYKFIKYELTEFCKKRSVMGYVTVLGNKVNPSLCVGSSHHKSYRRSNIKCKRRVSEVRRFMCQGNCFISGRLKTDQTRKMAETFGCEDLKLENEVEITVEEMKKKRMTNQAIDFNNFAKNRFLSLHMTEFCRNESKTRYFWESKNGKSNSRWKTISLCGSSGRNVGASDGSVRCIQTFPRKESVDCKIMGFR